MKINQIKIQDIKPYEKNAKKHTRKQIDQVANSIKRFGFVQPLVIDKNNELIIGHCRLEASKKLGMTEVPTLKLEDLSEEEVKALRLADNKLNESAWDMDLVIPELKGLSDDLLDLTGFDRDLIIEPEDKDDEVPEVPKKPRSKLGDLYELGNHRVLCGDATKKEDVERLMDGKKADCVVTDPPYNTGMKGKPKDE
ncbi:MAG: ParB N-terminal domain-containing protein, partial [Bacteroidales bacterium]